jgi:hypothetical protein
MPSSLIFIILAAMVRLIVKMRVYTFFFSKMVKTWAAKNSRRLSNGEIVGYIAGIVFPKGIAEYKLALHLILSDYL